MSPSSSESFSSESSKYPFSIPDSARSSFSGARCLVTGAAGLIGSAVIWALNNSGCERVVAVDRLGRSEKWRHLVPLKFEDYLEAEDLLPNLNSGQLGEFDFAFHLGACSATTETDAEFLIRNNFEFTKDLARWCLDHGCRLTYASSAATYGDGSRGMRDDSVDLEALTPLNMYGYSKHLFDLFARREGWLDRLVGVKYFNVFGPNEDHKGEQRSVVHKAFEQIVETGRMRLFRSYRPDYADGEQTRDFLYVKDAVAMTLHLASASGASGLYNVGSGRAQTWVELATAVFSALGRDPKIEFIEMPEALRDRYQYHTCATLDRLRASGYDAEVPPLDQSVADYVQSYLQTNRPLGR